MNIAVFYHCLFVRGDPPEMMPHALGVVDSQMDIMARSGLLEACDEFHVGINGGEESQVYAESLLPIEKANLVYHGRQCMNELRTLVHLQQIMTGRKKWKILYFHSKGATHEANDEMSHRWRNCMMKHLVENWKIASGSLEGGADSSGCHWQNALVSGISNIWAGNFWWITSEFLATLPKIEMNSRLPIMGGIDALASRYEAEVWIGSGRKMPKVRDFHRGSPFECPKI
jgi:hypothetical protein